MDSETIPEWCEAIASLCVDALLQAKIINPGQVSQAQEIINEEIFVRIVMGDLPPAADEGSA